MPYSVAWTESAHEDLANLFDYVAEHASVGDADRLYERLLNSTVHLSEFPRLYAAAPEWGEGVRRISALGQHVLYMVDDEKQVVYVLAVVGERQLPEKMR